MKYVLITREDIVENVILADDDFVRTIADKYKEIRKVDDDVRVMPGSTINKEDPKLFDDPVTPPKEPQRAEDAIANIRAALEDLRAATDPEDYIKDETVLLLEASIKSMEDNLKANAVVGP